MEIDIFIKNIEYVSYFKNQLTLSSTFLGLLIATSTFLLQSGFSSFEYSRSMFLKYYVRLTKFLFLLLAYNIVISVVFLYVEYSYSIAFYTHCIFSLMFIKYFLDFYSHKGYIHTIHSTKFNPHNNRLRKYLRYIFNLGFVQVIVILVLLFIVIGYPLMFGKCGCFSERQGFVSTVIAFVFSVISLIRILPQYFIFSEQEYKQKQNNELSKEIDVDVIQELSILKDILIKNGRKELEESISIDDINGDVNVRLADKKDEAFFVINANIKTSNVEQIVRWIEKYSFNFFRDLNDTSVDINSFVHSYFLYIDGIKEPKTFFIRARRSELDDTFAKNLNPTEFVNSMKNKVIDELFRSV